MTHLLPKPHWLQSWPGRLGAGPGPPNSLPVGTQHGAWDEYPRPQLNYCIMGVLVGKDSETQVGGCFFLGAPLPSFRVGGYLGRTLAKGHGLPGDLGEEEQDGKLLATPCTLNLDGRVGGPSGCPPQRVCVILHLEISVI